MALPRALISGADKLGTITLRLTRQWKPAPSPAAPLRMRRPLSTSWSRRYASNLVTVEVPQMAESISEGTLATFHKNVGDRVEGDEEIANIETDKVDVAVNASVEGILSEVLVQEGDTVVVGQPLARIDTGAEAKNQPATEANKLTEEPERQNEPSKSQKKPEESLAEQEPLETTSTEPPESQPQKTPQPRTVESPVSATAGQRDQSPPGLQQAQSPESMTSETRGSRAERVEKLSRMRKTIATRLKESQNTCASLTTMQELDMSALMQWRSRYRDQVAKDWGIKLGYMGAFAKAATLAAQQTPVVNASIDTVQEVITFRDYVDVSIAVSSPKGLVTPVVRNCESLGVLELEREIGHVAKKARDGKLTMDDLTGGNFSISNPGIFNSMFGTPLINYPQAAVFNMNTIKERPVAIDGKVEIRPMMYITLTYDHRLIDGREAVSFLNMVKSYVEDPAKMLLVC